MDFQESTPDVEQTTRFIRHYCPCPYPLCDGRIPCYPHDSGRYHCVCPDRRIVTVRWDGGKPSVSAG